MQFTTEEIQEEIDKRAVKKRMDAEFAEQQRIQALRALTDEDLDDLLSKSSKTGVVTKE